MKNSIKIYKKRKRKEISSIINIAVNNNYGSIKVKIFDKTFDPYGLMDSFSMAVNAIKSWHSENSDVNSSTDERTYEIGIDPKTGCISVDIFTADFNVDELMRSFAYSIGYLQGCFINCSDVEK